MQSNLIAGSTQVINVLNQRMQRAFDNDSLPIPPLAMSLVQRPEPQNNGVWGQTFSSWSRNSGATVTWASWTATPPASCWGQIANWRTITCGSAATSATAGGDYDVDSRRSSTDTDNYHLGLYAAGQQDAFSLRGAWVTPGTRSKASAMLISAASRIG